MFEIKGFIIILAHVQCIYDIEEADTGYSFGFKFSNSFWEAFTFKTKEEATQIRKDFINSMKEFTRTKEAVNTAYIIHN